MTTPTKKPGPSLWLSLVVMGVSMAVAVVSLGFFVRPFVQTFADAPRFPTPGQFTVHLGKGTYLIYDEFARNLQPDQVTVQAPSGDSLTVDTPTDTETIRRNGRDFKGAVRFHTP